MFEHRLENSNCVCEKFERDFDDYEPFDNGLVN